MSKYNDLVRKLKEIFQIDRPELDFGIYRILNARVGEINDYLENRLKSKVQASLSKQIEGDSASKIKELAAKIREEYGKRVFDEQGNLADESVKKSELGQQFIQLQLAVPTAAEHENAVFSHLLTFFSRYYDKGDFISQRRYKGDTYAIPYAGEEVMLHWANKDQFYTKSGENFSNYGFKLADGRMVRFRLLSADTAKDNRKDNDKERRFVLIERHIRCLVDADGDEYEQAFLPVEEVNAELIIRFEYKAMPKGSKQDDLVKQAVEAILADECVKARWLALSQREPTEKNPHRTLLEKCLTSYTSKNSADYFIHKDLGGFLRRELDFYIKSEVMHLDDVQYAETFADIEKNLRLIQTLRAIALDLVGFLAQLEDFQKKLWLKKKFVVATHYCITLDRVEESLYPAIAANPLQWAQWDELGMLDGDKADLFAQAKTGSVEYLKAHPFLMVDTGLFDAGFKCALLAVLDNLDDSLDGLLIQGDNFQALSLLKESHKNIVQCIYIDPPYNTGGDDFVYKDNYQHSSWMSMINDRMNNLLSLCSSESVLFLSIDDNESAILRLCLDEIFGLSSFESQTIIQSNKRGQTYQKIAKTHEYLFIYRLGENSGLAEIEKKISNSALSDNLGAYELWELRNRNPKFGKHNRPNLYYPIYVDTENLNSDGYAKVSLENTASYSFNVYPQNSVGYDSCWRWGKEKLAKSISDGGLNIIVAKQKRDGGWNIYEKSRKSSTKAKSIWSETQVINEQGTVEVGNLGFTNFGFPKPTGLLEKILKIGSLPDEIVLDFFAGSGTTAHAVINLNREDNGKRKYILVDIADYFNTVLKPRIQKAAYSADWKNGKATAPHTGISHAFKVLKIESYEDTLNNLELHRNQAQQNLLNALPPSAQEEYLLHYLLNIESRGSLLSVEQFKKPFDCKLKVTVDSAGAYEERTIDLIETFNYLIGLRVKHIDMQLERGFALVTGLLPSAEKALVLWRDIEKLDYDSLNRLCEKLAINPADSEFDIVFINGDHNIPAVFTSTEAEGGISKTLKIRQIEPEFMARMFDAADV